MSEDKRILDDARWIEERADWLVSHLQGYAITHSPSLKESIRSVEQYIFDEANQESQSSSEEQPHDPPR